VHLVAAMRHRKFLFRASGKVGEYALPMPHIGRHTASQSQGLVDAFLRLYPPGHAF
jgi:hypothetical protein